MGCLMANNDHEHQNFGGLSHTPPGREIAGPSQAEIEALLAKGDGRSLGDDAVERIFRKAGLSSRAAGNTQADAELDLKTVELVTQAFGYIRSEGFSEGDSERLFAGSGDAALAADFVDRVFEKAAAICLLEDLRHGLSSKATQVEPGRTQAAALPGAGTKRVPRRLGPFITVFGRVAAVLLVSTFVVILGVGRLELLTWMASSISPDAVIASESERLVEDAEAYRKLRVGYTQSGLPTENAEAVARAIADMRESLEKRKERLKLGVSLSDLGMSELARQRKAFQEAKDTADKLLASAASPTPSKTSGERAFILVDSDPQGRVYEAAEEARPELKGWTKDERGGIVKYEDIDRLNSIRMIPGGVAFGKVIEVNGDWKDAGLFYDIRDRRGYLVLGNGKRIKLPKVDPAVLKACFAFARSSDSVAVSIGWTGEQSDFRIDRSTSPVLLHPALRDTLVGRDIIDVDRLPWHLRDYQLPNGKWNSFVETLRPLIDMEIAREGVNVTHLSLLTDDHVQLVEREGGMEFATGLKIRYIHNRDVNEYEDQRGGHGVVEATGLGNVVTDLIPQLEASYPTLRAAREYASWTALLRWATNKNNLAWVDLADLATINDRVVPTPDYILRGSEPMVRAAARRFGLDLETLPSSGKTTVPPVRDP
jgi:hypothetical protein